MSLNNNPFELGKHANRMELPPLMWSPDDNDSINPHGLVCGTSGSGKTTLIRKIVENLVEQGKHVYVFDLKGDMQFQDKQGHTIGNYMNITAWDSEYGINPFEFDTGVPKDELELLIVNPKVITKEQEFKVRNSGPRTQVELMIEIIRKNFLPNMGAMQRDYLMYLLTDTYTASGFKYNDINTWTKELPTLKDTLELIKMISIYNDRIVDVNDEYSSDFITSLKTNIVGVSALKKRLLEEEPEGDEKDKLETLIKEKESSMDSEYREFKEVAATKYGPKDIEKLDHEEWFKTRGINPEKYGAKGAMKTIEALNSYLSALDTSEIFKDKKPPVKTGLNIINISGLSHQIQKVLVDIWLGKVFRACKIRGKYEDREDKSRGRKCDTFVVIDESKLISGEGKDKKDPFSFLNRIATESRGNGLGILVGAQSADHFPPEFLKNFSLQIILNTSIADAEVVRKGFGVDKEMLKYTQDKQNNALVKKNKEFVKIKLSHFRENINEEDGHVTISTKSP